MNISRKFSISYDADSSSFTDHSIDALQLAESIQSVAEMINQADKLLNGDDSTVKVMVTAPAKEGSLCIDFETILQTAQSVDIIKELGFYAIGTAGFAGSALSVIQRLKKKKVIELEENTDTDEAVITVSGGDSINCTSTVAKLVTDPLIRQAINTLIQKPLEGKESPKFKIINDDNEVVFNEAETETFTPLQARTLVKSATETKESNISFTQVNFQGTSGWKMMYHGEKVSVKMEDEAFLIKVRDSQAKFSKDDLFVVKLDITRTESPRGNTTRYSISKVIRHRAAEANKIV